MSDPSPLRSPAVRWLIGLLVAAAVIGVIVFVTRDDDESEPADRDVARAVSGWSLPNADPTNSRSADSKIDAGTVDELGVLWKQELSPFEGERAFNSTPLIVDGVVYGQDLNSNVWAYDLESGDELWRRKLRSPAAGANGLAYENGRVFGATAADAFALDADNGSLEWRVALVNSAQRLAPRVATAPMVVDGLVYVGTGSAPGGGALVVLDAASGDEVHRIATPVPGTRVGFRTGGVTGTPYVDEGEDVYVGVGGSAADRAAKPDGGSLRSIDGETGEVDWTFTATLEPAAAHDLTLSPAPIEVDDEDAVAIAGTAGVVYAVDEDGTELWQHATVEEAPRVAASTAAQFAVAKGTIYAPTPTAPAVAPALVAIDADSGEEQWRTAIEGDTVGAATVSNDLVFVPSGSTLRAFTTADGSEAWSTDLDVRKISSIAIWKDYVVVGGTVEVGDTVRPTVVVLQLGASRELEPELSADVEDEAEEVSETPAKPAPDLPGVTPDVPGDQPTTPPADGDDDGDHDGDDDTPGTDEPESPDEPGDGDADDVVKIGVASGKLKFEPTKLTVDAGTVTFRFTNPDSLPHDFVILDEDGDRVDGTDLIAEDTAELKVKLKAGTYRFICTPHEGAGMTGTLVVEDDD